MPLTELDLSGWHRLTDTGLSQLQKLPLRWLILGRCLNLTNLGLSHLRGTPLTHLDLTNCDWVTDASLEVLRDLPLARLVVYGCHGLSPEALEAVPGPEDAWTPDFMISHWGGDWWEARVCQDLNHKAKNELMFFQGILVGTIYPSGQLPSTLGCSSLCAERWYNLKS